MYVFDKDSTEDSPKKRIRVSKNRNKKKKHPCKDPAMNVLIEAGIVPQNGRGHKKSHKKYDEFDEY